MNVSMAISKYLNFNNPKLMYILLGGVMFIGLASLIVPVYYIIIALLAMAVFGYFITKPEHCFYLVIFTIPFTERVRFLPISFSINDILILICSFVILIHLFFSNEKINLRTRIDGWIIALLVLYFASGFYSISDRGLLTSFKFMEAILAYYSTVYLIRSKRIKLTQILKILILTTIVQAILAIFQSTTGTGADFRSTRNILGYLGIGSRSVWHGIGTMGHFNTLGNYLVNITLVYLPFYFFCLKNIKIKNSILIILLTAIYMTYSRGSLIGLYLGVILLLYQVIKNKKLYFSVLLSSIILITGLYFILSHSHYTSTISDRSEIWEILMYSMQKNPLSIFFGSGHNSYHYLVWPYIPANIPVSSYGNWYAHNYYLAIFQSMGLIGSLVVFSFYIYLFFSLFKQYLKSTNKLYKTLNLSISLAIFSLFFVSLVDHSYGLTFFQILLFILLAIIYSKTIRTNVHGNRN